MCSSDSFLVIRPNDSDVFLSGALRPLRNAALLLSPQVTPAEAYY